MALSKGVLLWQSRVGSQLGPGGVIVQSIIEFGISAFEMPRKIMIFFNSFFMHTTIYA